LEPNAAILAPEECIQAHLDLSEAAGATLRYAEPALDWGAEAGRVRVRTERQTYQARRLVLSPGAWIRGPLARFELPVEIERQVLFWFHPLRTPEIFDPARCPVFILEYAKDRFFYGLPDTGDGLKVALHHQGERADPDGPLPPVSGAEERGIREFLARYLPAANGSLVETATCLYTNAPDGHFILDRHPAFPEVILASPCSGHGFKFSSTIGEVISDLVLEGRTRHDISLFSARRFSSDRP
jgi:sarcosine oxidase